MKFEIVRIEIATGKEYNMGIYSEEDMKDIVRGFKFNGLFYERKNGKSIYVVTEA